MLYYLEWLIYLLVNMRLPQSTVVKILQTFVLVDVEEHPFNNNKHMIVS